MPANGTTEPTISGFGHARFYFDTPNGSTLNREAEGHELADIQAARNMAMRALPDMARDTENRRQRPPTSLLMFGMTITGMTAK